MRKAQAIGLLGPFSSSSDQGFLQIIVGLMSQNLESALHYAKLNYRVFPLHGFINGICSCCRDCKITGNKPGKHPASMHGYKDGSIDPDIVTALFAGKPWLNVGIALDSDCLGVCPSIAFGP